MRWLLLMLLGLQLQVPPLPARPFLKIAQVQEPTPDPTAPTPARPWGRYDQVEGAYCMHGTPLPEQLAKGAHECGCKLLCQDINDGSESIRVEDHSCATYCNGGKTCVCHPDVSVADPCGMSLPKEGEPLGDPFGLKPPPEPVK